MDTRLSLLEELNMSTSKQLIASALGAVVAMGTLAPATVHAGEKEKCYGIAKAGKNDCASATGVHSCAAQAKADHDLGDWKFVAKGSCEKLGGSLQPKK